MDKSAAKMLSQLILGSKSRAEVNMVTTSDRACNEARSRQAVKEGHIKGWSENLLALGKQSN